MNIPVAARPRSLEVNMLPMINIIFLLLVFVMLTGGAVRANLPSDEDERAAVVLTIGAAGDMRLTGVPVTLAQLAGRVRQTDQPLDIRADEALPATQLLETLEALRSGGIEQASLRAMSSP